MVSTNQNGVQNEKSMQPRLIKLIVLLAGVIILAFCAYYIQNNRNKSTNSSDTSSSWTHYKSDKYGIEFDYLNSWGKPNVYVNNRGQGKRFDILFTKTPPDLSHSVKIMFDSGDTTIKACDETGGCQTVPGVTENYIQNQLKNNKYINQYIITKSSDSYTTMIPESQGSDLFTLSVYKSKKISKLSTSAVVGAYAMKVGKNCPAKTISKTDKNCINETNLKDLNTALDSLNTI